MIRITIILLALLLLLAAAGCTTADSTNDHPNQSDINDDAQICAAAIRQIYNVDHSFGEPPGWPLVYILTTTDDSAMVDAPAVPAQKLAAELQEAITAELTNEPFELIWIDAFDDAPIDPANGQIAEGEGIVITLGNIHPQDDGSVQMPFSMTCGGLCGIGKTYVLNQIDDIWQISGSVGPEIMS